MNTTKQLVYQFGFLCITRDFTEVGRLSGHQIYQWHGFGFIGGTSADHEKQITGFGARDTA